MNRRLVELKFRFLWFIGGILCFVIFYSGFFFLYEYVRKRILKRYRTVVLMYHRVSDDNKYPDITVNTGNFQVQMNYLKAKYNILSLSVLVEHIEASSEGACDAVAITFDDGFMNNYQSGFPVLQQLDIPATIFLISSLIDNNAEMLSLDAIMEMKKRRISFGSHTCSHPILSEIDDKSAQIEISTSKQALENILEEEVSFFAYPKGKGTDFSENTKMFVKDAGYKAAFTTINGDVYSSADIFSLQRIGMRNYPLFVFRVRLSGIFESKPIYFLRRLLALT